MTRHTPRNDSEAFFRIIEQQARHYPVEARRITGKNKSFRGLLLLYNGLSGPEREKIPTRIAEMSVAEFGRAKEEDDDQIRHAPVTQEEDSCQVTIEERAQLFRFLQSST